MKKKLLCLLLITACSATPEDPDPHKDFNEAMLEFNVSLDKNVLKPASQIYEDVTCEPTQRMISNFLDNLNEPFYFVNYTVQLSPCDMSTSLFRFLINSTVGIFGFFDVAELIDLPKHKTNYKETLHKMHMPHGDYIVLPIFGFSSTRDTIAEPISWFANPVNYFLGWPLSISKSVLQMIVDRSENAELIDSTIQESDDLYSKTRSVYLQQYGNGFDVPDDEDGPSPDDEDEQ